MLHDSCERSAPPSGGWNSMVVKTALGLVGLAAALGGWASPRSGATGPPPDQAAEILQSTQPAAGPTPEVPQGGQERWQTLYGEADSLYRQKKYAEALPIAREALRVPETSFGPEHPNVALSVFAVAAIHHSQGKFAEAEPLYRRALAIAEKVLGPDHPDVGRMLSSLAAVPCEQKRYADAEPLYRRSGDRGKGPETR